MTNINTFGHGTNACLNCIAPIFRPIHQCDPIVFLTNFGQKTVVGGLAR